MNAETERAERERQAHEEAERRMRRDAQLVAASRALRRGTVQRGEPLKLGECRKIVALCDEELLAALAAATTAAGDKPLPEPLFEQVKAHLDSLLGR